DKPSAALRGISLGKDGVLMCAGKKPEQCGDPEKLDDPIEFITKPNRGEPTRLAFVAGDFKIGIVLMPDPINDMSAGCTLSAIRMTPKFELAFMSGSGYKPNTDVHYRVVSQNASDATVK